MGALWVDFSHMRVTLGQLWGHFVVTLAFEGDFGGTLASLWEQFWHMRVTLGSLWGQFGVTFGV